MTFQLSFDEHYVCVCVCVFKTTIYWYNVDRKMQFCKVFAIERLTGEGKAKTTHDDNNSMNMDLILDTNKLIDVARRLHMADSDE